GVVDAHARLARDPGHQALVDGEGPDGRGAVAAVTLVIHDRVLHVDLGEGVVHVGARVRRRADDARLGERGDAAAEPVELAAVRVGTPERREQDPVAVGTGARQVGRVEEERAAGPAAHEHGADPFLDHARARVCARRPPARRMSRPAAFARGTNSGSRYLKQNSAIVGMLERKTRIAAPAGEMSSVETLSPSFSSTGASSVSATGSPSGTDLMFGPRMTSPWPSGMTSPAPEAAKLSGR